MNIKDTLRKASNTNLSEEICGFIVIKDGNIDFLKMENRAYEKDKHFLIPAKDFLHAKENNKIIAVFHTHIQGDSKPSTFDVAMSEATCLPLVIYSNEEKKFSFYKPEFSNENSSELERIFI